MTHSLTGMVISGPAKLKAFAHVSLPCRDLNEGKRFYARVLGGTLDVDEKDFVSFHIAGVEVGLGTEGCSWIQPGMEYPHIAFFVDADALVAMREWLTRCDVPVSNLWTRFGVEALMFFRDPSGNVIELFCDKGYKDAASLPRGPARGHGTAVDIDKLRYTQWKLP